MICESKLILSGKIFDIRRDFYQNDELHIFDRDLLLDKNKCIILVLSLCNQIFKTIFLATMMYMIVHWPSLGSEKIPLA